MACCLARVKVNVSRRVDDMASEARASAITQEVWCIGLPGAVMSIKRFFNCVKGLVFDDYELTVITGDNGRRLASCSQYCSEHS